MLTFAQNKAQAQKAESSGFGRARAAIASDYRQAQSSAPASSRVGFDFSRIPIPSSADRWIQTKLTVNTPGDRHEQEADRVSEQVVRMTEPQRPGLGGQGVGGQVNAPLQVMRDGGSGMGQAAAPPIVHEVLRTPGQPLNAETRAYMEPRFGHDFSQVRVHDDPLSARSAEAVAAQAYTVGSDVVFGSGRYAPASGEGQRLLAHELTHVVQQGRTGPRVQRAPDPGKSAPAAKPQETNSPPKRAPEEAVANEAAKPEGHPLKTLRVWLKAFIPQAELEGPPGYDCFRGDNRSYSPDRDAPARMTSEVLLEDLDTPIPKMTETHRCGLTRQVDCGSGKLVNSGTAATDGMTFFNLRYPGEVVWDWDKPYPPPAHPPEITVGESEPVSVDYKGLAADPLVPFAPGIDIWAHLALDLHTGEFSINGKADDYPAFEGWVTVNEKHGPFNLFTLDGDDWVLSLIGGANRPFDKTISLGSYVASESP